MQTAAARNLLLLTLLLPLAASCQSTGSSRQEAEGINLTKQSNPLPTSPAALDVNGLAADAYAIEKALGARCPKNKDESMEGGGLMRGACSGRVPIQVADMLRSIPESEIYWPLRQREQWLERERLFLAVAGLGQRSDFLVGSEEAWIRSFEGPDPDRTVYLVRGPAFHLVDPEYKEALNPAPGENCWQVSFELNVYEVVGNLPPRNVTAEIMPPPPTMTADERQRYGPYIASSRSEACDSHIAPDIYRLQYAPTIRWTIEDLDPVTPIPRSDPRSPGDLGWPHFGFLVWTGERFELRQRVPRALWPCRPVFSDQAPCSLDEDAAWDRFVTEDKKGVN